MISHRIKSHLASFRTVLISSVSLDAKSQKDCIVDLHQYFNLKIRKICTNDKSDYDTWRDYLPLQLRS